MKPITREQAASAGQAKFYTGKRCPSGHLDQRWVLSGACVECSRISSRNSQARKRKALKAAIMKGLK